MTAGCYSTLDRQVEYLLLAALVLEAAGLKLELLFDLDLEAVEDQVEPIPLQFETVDLLEPMGLHTRRCTAPG